MENTEHIVYTTVHARMERCVRRKMDGVTVLLDTREMTVRMVMSKTDVVSGVECVN